jgi:hypothetical protein
VSRLSKDSLSTAAEVGSEQRKLRTDAECLILALLDLLVLALAHVVMPAAADMGSLRITVNR